MGVVGEIVRVLRFTCDVLAEYVAVERRKRAEAQRQAEEQARGRAEEAVARAAQEQALRERLLARKSNRATSRGRKHRGDGPRASVTIEARPIPVAQPDAFCPALQHLPPSILALINQFSSLHAAILDFFTATGSLREWFRRIQAHPTKKMVAQGVITGVMMLLDRVIRKVFRYRMVQRYYARCAANRERVQRMLKGDWRDAIRYIVWTKQQRWDPPPLAAGPAMVSAGGW